MFDLLPSEFYVIEAAEDTCGRGTPQGLAGIISSPIMHWWTFFILLHHFYTEKQVYICYFLIITASKPVGHVFIWLAHLQLNYHLNLINNCKHVKKEILIHFSFPKNNGN